MLVGWIDPSASAVTAAALPALSVVIAAFIIAAACNSTNLIDGMDGLCAGVVLISAVGFAAVTGALVAKGAIESTGAMLIITIAAAAAGACSAFLLFNFNPASMFMGDSGSLLLGFSVATTLVLLAELAGWRGLIAGAIAFGFPFFDTALAVGRRWLNTKPLFTGDRSHFYDQIRDRGYSVKQTVVGCYGLQFAFAATGVVCAIVPMWSVVCIAAGLPIAGWLVCRRFGLLRIERP
ncbi:MAG: undecaprenyl/decaprenyl-phosphate alpha-N-acetylglucosaminyl 1-phosphate transferase [Planctomycetes bacterium]|nr:undecaprenyl/decaprenyl-phosphate alpha-N-acetylglucosaminyl 1-phosphate transferase [Planctomycetota bacterium]